MVNREFVHLSWQGKVSIVTIDRPPVNAYNLQVHREIYETFTELSDDPNLRCAILTAAGAEDGRPFGAGSDVKEFVGLTKSTSLERAAQIRPYFPVLQRFPVPVIAAIEGAAVGSGLGWASRADIRVISERARFGMPEVKVGALGGSAMLLRLIGAGKAREMIYTGDLIDAQEAYRIGLAEHLVAPGEALGKALELAEKIASLSPIAVRLAKKQAMSSESFILNVDEAYKIETELTAELRDHPDSSEAAKAFLEKRKPEFVGSASPDVR